MPAQWKTTCTLLTRAIGASCPADASGSLSKKRISLFYNKSEVIAQPDIMSVRKYLPVLLIGCIALVVLLLYSAQQPVYFGNSSTVRPTPVPVYPALNISETVKTPQGTMIINASVPESLAVMPVYRLNMSDRHTLTVNRIPMFPEISEYSPEKSAIPPALITDTQDVKQTAEKFLRKYHGLPDDIVIWKALDLQSPWGGETPSELDPYQIYKPYTRIAYTRMINGQPVDNWGINHEEISLGGYGTLSTDHDFIIVGLRKDGDLIFITERWTKSEYIRDEPVLSVREALDRVKKWENAKEDYGSVKDLKVQTIRQGYFEATRHTSIIEPAWFFSGINRDGHDQTVVVLARKNDSAELPFYNYSHKDPSLPDEWAGSKNYRNWAKENYVNGTEIGIEKAKDIVKSFSKTPDLVIESIIPVQEKTGCCSWNIFYNITTNEGIYTIDPKITVVRSVSYPVNVTHTRPNPVEFPEILDISSDYVHENFGYYPDEDFTRNPYITENPETYRVRIPASDFTILLDIDKKTGDVVGYTNANALPPEIC